jgi:hypothetical protein
MNNGGVSKVAETQKKDFSLNIANGFFYRKPSFKKLSNQNLK